MVNANKAKEAGLRQVDSALVIRQTIVLCISAIVVIGLCDIFIAYYQLAPWLSIQMLFNVTHEQSVGNWFSSLLAIFNASIAGLIVLSHKAEIKAEDKSTSTISHKAVITWRVIAIFFFYLGIDDALSIHERLGIIIKAYFDNGALEYITINFPSYAWQLYIAPLFILMGLHIAYFLRSQLVAKLTHWMLIAFALLGVAVGIDFVEGLFLHFFSSVGAGHALRLIEELIEMLGMTLFLAVFLSHYFSRETIFLQQTNH